LRILAAIGILSLALLLINPYGMCIEIDIERMSLTPLGCVFLVISILCLSPVFHAFVEGDHREA